MFALFPSRMLAFAIAALCLSTSAVSLAGEAPCATEAPCAVPIVVEPSEPSWIFRRSTFTNDPETGARVAQYMRTPPVEPLDDPRLVTSRYRRSRTNLRGNDGSVDTYYEVQSWGNGRGGIDAEWERFHDAWKDSYLQGGYHNQGPGYFAPGGNGFRHGGWGNGNNFPGQGYPGYGGPWQGGGGNWQGGGGNWQGGGPGPGGGHPGWHRNN
jgi:hypothetical protein